MLLLPHSLLLACFINSHLPQVSVRMLLSQESLPGSPYLKDIPGCYSCHLLDCNDFFMVGTYLFTISMVGTYLLSPLPLSAVSLALST